VSRLEIIPKLESGHLQLDVKPNIGRRGFSRFWRGPNGRSKQVSRKGERGKGKERDKGMEAQRGKMIIPGLAGGIDAPFLPEKDSLDPWLSGAETGDKERVCSRSQ
jgi:hypothetical protein